MDGADRTGGQTDTRWQHIYRTSIASRGKISKLNKGADSWSLQTTAAHDDVAVTIVRVAGRFNLYSQLVISAIRSDYIVNCE